MRWALREQALVIVWQALAPASVGIVASGLGQYRVVVNPLLVARKVHEALVIIHEPPV